MKFWPTKKQWLAWSLPSKLTAIGTAIGIISLGLYLLDKVPRSPNNVNLASTYATNLSKMRMRLSSEYVRSLFGIPITERHLKSGSREVLYKFENYFLQIVYDEDSLVSFFAVTLRNSSFRYEIPYLPEKLILGTATYADFGAPRTNYFNVGSKSAEYYEEHYYGNPGYYMDFYPSFTDAGVNFTSKGIDDVGDSEICVVRENELETLRRVLRPNTIGISSMANVEEFDIGPSYLTTRELE